MVERRHHMKESLGISEYPWSSDDDDTETPGGSELQSMQQHTEADVGRPSASDNPGTSGQQPMSGASSSGRETTRPLFFFSSTSTPRTYYRNRDREEMPLSLLMSSPAQAQAQPTPSFSPVLVNRKINRQSSMRIRAIAHGHLRRHLGATSPRTNRYPIHANPAVTTAMALRRAQAIADLNLNNSSVSVQDYHDALLRADLAEALRSYDRPSTSRSNADTAPNTPPASLGPPHDVIQALSEQLQSDSHMDNSAPSMQPVNLSHPDDSFLDEDLHPNRNETPTADERNELSIEYENETSAQANESNNAVNDVTIEAGDDTGSGVDASMSLEQVVEIDADPEPAPDAQPQPPQQIQHTEESVANTSSASDELSIVQPHRMKRKKESDDDNNELGTGKEYNQSLLRLLECPVCLEWMEPPMWQCRRGHLVCGRCRARLNACPVCRTAFSSVRNRAMEGVSEMVRYPCRHGCGRDLHLRRRSAHEASCVARRYRCPAPQCDTRPPLAHKDLAPHFQSKHLSMMKLGHSHTFSMRVNSEQHDNWIILALHQLFHLRVDVDIRTWGVVVYVAYIGPKCNADDFIYEVTVTGQHNSRKLVYSRATHCDLECSSLNMSRQDCFHLTLDQALNFLRVRNRNPEPAKYLHFSVNIARSVASNDDESN